MIAKPANAGPLFVGTAHTTGFINLRDSPGGTIIGPVLEGQPLNYYPASIQQAAVVGQTKVYDWWFVELMLTDGMTVTANGWIARVGDTWEAEILPAPLPPPDVIPPNGDPVGTARPLVGIALTMDEANELIKQLNLIIKNARLAIDGVEAIMPILTAAVSRNGAPITIT